MSFSKTFLFVGLVFAIVLILSPHVCSARELAEVAQTQGSVEDDKHGHNHGHWGHEHGHGHWGHGHDDHHGHGHRHGHRHGHEGKPGHDGAGEN